MSELKRSRYLICYDIVNDKMRHKLAEMLLDYGDRLQMSVFEADLSDNDVEIILSRAKNYVTDIDSFRVYFICKTCKEKVHVIGRPFAIFSDGMRIV